MALTVGELLATISVDDAPARAGMQRTEAAMQRTGDTIVAEAEQAGADAGQALADGVEDGADQAAERGSGALAAFGWAAVGATVGAALMAGIGQALEQGKVTGSLQAQLGTTGPIAAQHGKVAGDLYADAIVDSVEEGAAVIKGIAQGGLLPPEATQGQIKALGQQIADTAAVMGEDVGRVSRAVGTMLKTGVADSASEAMDILVRGTQRGGNAAEDLLDTFTEYSTQFRSVGLDGQTAMGLIQQGLQAGARDADTVADAIKEFSIEAVAGSDKIRGGFESLGLDADGLFAAIGKGGNSASGAFDTILDSLRGVEDPIKRNAIATELFGTKAEDLGEALYSLDPSSAVKALGDVKGATDAAGKALHDNAATRFEAFKRGAMQALVGVVGNYVVPALMTGVDVATRFGRGVAAAAGFVSEHSTAFSVAAGIITAFFLPTLIALGATAWATTTAVVSGWIAQSAAGAGAAASFLAANTAILTGWIAQGAAAVAAAARVVGAWIAMGTQAMIQAARMAAAWLISMGPVGLIIAAVVALVALIVTNWDTIVSATKAAWEWVWNKVKEIAQFLLDVFLNWTIVGLIIKHWDSIKTGTARVWNSIIEWVQGIPGRIANLFLNWTVVGLIIKHWDSIKTGTIRKASEMIEWVRGISGRIGSAIGNLSGLLVEKGKDIVRGLWSGIKSMGSWLKDQLVSFAKNSIPGPIAKALGIASPSKVLARDVGRWIPAGLVQGIQSGQGAVDRAMSNLVTPPAAPGLTPAGAAPYGTPFTGAGGGALVHVEHWHAAEQGSPDDNARALAWVAKARG